MELLIFWSTLFVAVSILGFIGWVLFIKKEYAFLVRPSVVFIASLYLIYLVPSQVYFERLKSMSPYLGQASLLLSIVLFGALCGAYLLFRKFDFREEYSLSFAISEKHRDALMLLVFFMLVICTGLYFSQVKFSNTGLFAIICDPRHYVILREKSLKLTGIKWLGYVYLIGFSCLCPLLSTLFIDRLFFKSGKEIRKTLVWGLLLFMFILFYLLITGARVGLLYCSLAVTGVLWYRLSLRRFIPAATIAIAGALAVSALISMAWVNRIEQVRDETGSNYFCSLFPRTVIETSDLDQKTATSWTLPQSEGFSGYFEGILFRVFSVPAVISGWYLEEGYSTGMRPSYLYTAEGRSMSNSFAIKYVKRIYGDSYQPGKSVATPTSFVFVNFIYFGYWSIFVSILGILLLDVAFLVAKKINRDFATPLLAMCLYYTFIFAQTGYFTVIVSHGYFVVVVIIAGFYIAGRLARQRAVKT